MNVFAMPGLRVHCGDCHEVLKRFPAGIFQTCVTSPPYWNLRDFGCEGQAGLEETPEQYVEKMVAIFREVWRVLRDDGTLWLNMGDGYAQTTIRHRAWQSQTGGLFKSANNGDWINNTRSTAINGLKPKDLCGIPWHIAFALQANGWYLRSDIIWHKPNPMLESVTDRPTKSHEFIFLLAKQERYFYDADAIREPHTESWRGNGEHETNNPITTENPLVEGRSWTPAVRQYNPAGRNKRTVWTVATQAFSEAHFATFPEDLIKPCILAGSRLGDIVLDPFAGSGTTGIVALELGRRATLIELNPDYIELIKTRTNITPGFL